MAFHDISNGVLQSIGIPVIEDLNLDNRKDFATGATQLLFEQSNQVITPAIKAEAMASWNKDGKVSTLVVGEPTQMTTRTLTVPVDVKDKRKVLVLTFVGTGFEFTLKPADYQNNEVTKAQVLAEKIRLGVNQEIAKIENKAVYTLAQKSTNIIRRPLDFDFSSGSRLVATHDQRTQLISNLDIIEQGNNYFGEVTVLGDTGAAAIFREIMQFGANNSQNKAMTLDGKRFILSNSMPILEGYQATGFAVPQNVFGIVERNQMLNTMSYQTTDEWRLGTVNFAGLGLPLTYETYFAAKMADVSTATGNALDTASAMEIYKFFTEFCIVSFFEPEDTQLPLPVIKFGVLQSGATTIAPEILDVESDSLTTLVVTFDSSMCATVGGEPFAPGTDIKAKLGLTLATPGATITSAIVGDNSDDVEITISGTVAAGDIVKTIVAIYDVEGTAFAAGNLAKVNAGATAWVVM